MKQDKLWWYSSLRDQDVQSAAAEFPGQAVRDASPATSRARQPTRSTRTTSWSASRSGARSSSRTGSTRSSIGATAAIHNSADSTWNQSYWAHTYKVGWDERRQRSRCSSRFTAASSTTCGRTRATRRHRPMQDLAHQHRQRRQPGRLVPQYPTRNQVLGIAQLLQGWLGRQSQLQDRRRDLRRALRLPARTGRRRPRARRRAAHFAERCGLRSAAFLSPTASLNGLRTYGALLADTWRVGLAPDARARRPIRSIPIVPPGADGPARRSVQPDAGQLRCRRQPA